MKKDNLIRLLSVSVCIVLIAAMALFTSGCGDKGSKGGAKVPTTSTTSTWDAKEVGSGKTSFKFAVVGEDGKEQHFTVKTDKKTVGEALIDALLISGEDQTMGYIVTTVNGEKAVYEEDGRYWAFYIDGEYANTGVMETDIDTSKIFCFKSEKA